MWLFKGAWRVLVCRNQNSKWTSGWSNTENGDDYIRWLSYRLEFQSIHQIVWWTKKSKWLSYLNYLLHFSFKHQLWKGTRLVCKRWVASTIIINNRPFWRSCSHYGFYCLVALLAHFLEDLNNSIHKFARSLKWSMWKCITLFNLLNK